MTAHVRMAASLPGGGPCVPCSGCPSSSVCPLHRSRLIPINYSSLAALEATGIGPLIADRRQIGFTDGRYEDGSVATGFVYGLFPEWFSSVYFNGTLYTYAYGVSELLCGNCDSDYWD